MIGVKASAKEGVKTKNEEWLEGIRARGKKLYAGLNWPLEADSPTEKHYTDYTPFGEAKGLQESGAEVRIRCEGGITAVELNQLKGENARLFKEKFGTLVNAREHKLLALKDAVLENGVLIHAPENAVGNVETDFAANKGSIGLHCVIVLEKGAKVNVYEKHSGGAGVVAHATEVFTGENAVLNYDYTQNQSLETACFGIRRAKLWKNSTVVWNSGFFGGSTTIARVESLLDGEGAKALNYSSFYGTGRQVFDITTNSIHNAPSTGDLLGKGIAAGESRATYRGLIHIAKTAPKTTCFLADHALLLGGKSKANSMPSLEILTNDVQSRHAATVEQVDDEKLFYLATRGLKKTEAVKTIVEGFAGEVFQKSGGKAAGEWQQLLLERMEK